MKPRYFIIVLLLPFAALAQSNRLADSLARERLKELLEGWTLGIDSASDAVDMRQYNHFKSLFGSSATVSDGFDVWYDYRDEKTGGYKTAGKAKAFDEYAHDVALGVKGIRVDDTAVLSSQTADEKNMIFQVRLQTSFQKERKFVLPEDYVSTVMQRRRDLRFDIQSDSLKAVAGLAAVISRTSDSVYRFAAVDTFTVVMAFDADSVVRIVNISRAGGFLRCENDNDNDAVLNSEDSLPGVFGDLTAHGQPDYDLDGIASGHDKCPTVYGSGNQGCPPSYFITSKTVDIFLGLAYNQHRFDLPELNALGYVDASGKDAMDVLQSRRGRLTSPSVIASVYAGAAFTRYFGNNKKKSGLSLGFTYTKFTSDYELTGPAVYTFKAFDGVNFYRRQISVKRLGEAIGYQLLNVPLLFSYRTRLSGSSVLNLKIGPSIMLFRNLSNYNAVVDFGGIYQIDKDRKDRITYYDFLDTASKYNLYFTSASLNTGGIGADSLFKLLGIKGYDFAADKNYHGQPSLNRFALGVNLSLDLQQKLAEGLTVKAGLTVVYATLLSKGEKYKPVDKTSDEFQSIYNSNAKSAYKAAGVSVGIVYNF